MSGCSRSVGETEGSELAETFLTSIAGLYDPHSTYFSADTYEDFGITMKLELVGIGAMLSLEDDICVVKEIIPAVPRTSAGCSSPTTRSSR